MNGYPNTYQSDLNQNSQIDRPNIFDPALKQHFYAFRLADPRFHDPQIAHQWFDARQEVINLLLRLIQNSRWHEHLVLRGSLLLKVWLGDIAREPGDIDWVFRPEDVKLGSNLEFRPEHSKISSDLLSTQLFTELIELVSANCRIGNITIDVAKIATDRLWTYERADGQRIIFPWQIDGLPPGNLQMDVVFGERLLVAPIQTLIPTTSGQDISIWSASKELSLAWKLLWLETDDYPQGKDLYDATLLAEQTYLPFDLLRQVLESSEIWKSQFEHRNRGFKQKPGSHWILNNPANIDWENFQLEYPAVKGDSQSWQDRLSLALSPTFTHLET